MQNLNYTYYYQVSAFINAKKAGLYPMEKLAKKEPKKFIEYAKYYIDLRRGLRHPHAALLREIEFNSTYTAAKIYPLDTDPPEYLGGGDVGEIKKQIINSSAPEQVKGKRNKVIFDDDRQINLF